MFNSINKKLIGFVSLLLLCTFALGVVALWSIREENILLRHVGNTVRTILGSTENLSNKVSLAAKDTKLMGEMAAQLGDGFKPVKKLIGDASIVSKQNRINNLEALAGTTLQLLDRYVETSKFLVDAIVKSRDMRESSPGFFYASIEEMGGVPDFQLSSNADPYEDMGTANDFIGSLVSSANADFYIAIGLKNDYRGKSLYSNQEGLFDIDLNNTYLFNSAIRENRITKSIDHINNDLVLGAASFVKSSKGEAIGILICGYWFSKSMLRFLSNDLKAQLAIFVANKNGEVKKAKYSTLVDSQGELLTNVPLPNTLSKDFTIKLKEQGDKARKAGKSIDGRSIRKDFIKVHESEVGGLIYDIAYQGLITDDGDFLGILAIARDVTKAVTQQNLILTGAEKAIQKVEDIDKERFKIAEANKKGQQEAAILVASTNQAKKKLEITLGTVEKVAGTAQMATIIALLVALCVGVLISFMIKRIISNPIKMVTAGLKDVAEGDGDLTKRLEVKSNDEIGELAKWFNIFIGEIHRIFKEFADTSNNLTSSSVELTTVSTQMASNAEEMNSQSNTVASASEQVAINVKTVASSTEQANSSVSNIANMSEEMSSTINEVAGAIQNTANESKSMANASGVISDGIGTMAVAIEEMTISLNEVAKNTTQASDVSQHASKRTKEINYRMDTLVNASKQIGKVVGVIKDIADQTNMLALNATIEAAGAGEAGKGFAVVAGEVKELAKQSAEATDEIAGQVEQIQQSTNEAVKAIREISKIITEIADINQTIATAVKEQTGTASEISKNVADNAQIIKEVASSADNSAQRMNEMDKATDDISKTANEVAKHAAELSNVMNEVANSSSDAYNGVENISKNIHVINNASKDTASGANQTSISSGKLSEMARNLTEIVSRFKL